MKTIAAICLLTATFNANAEVLGSRPNEGGGEIFLTASECGEGPLGSVVFSTDSVGLVTVQGCAYEMGGDRMLVDWGEGRLTVMDDLWRPLKVSEPGVRYTEM